MAEKQALTRLRNHNIHAAGLAILALAAGTSAAEASSTPEARAPQLENILLVGGNIHQKRMLSPDPDKNTSFRFPPIPRSDIKDQAVVFDKKVSDYLNVKMGDPIPGDRIGLIIESLVGATAVKLVFFEPGTGVIDRIDMHNPITVDHEREYNYTSSTNPSANYSLYISPQTKKHGVIVSFEHDRKP